MYPRAYLDLFRDFARRPSVFVAMPFSRHFEPRWKTIFRPAIQSSGLRPLRIKENVIGQSIPSEILEGIGSSTLVLADISPESGTSERALPNSNVMYELGIAHACRLPEEVIVVTDKARGEMPFDIRHIRWNRFSASAPNEAKKQIHSLIQNALREIDLLKDRMVERTVRSLDPDMAAFLNEARSHVESGFDLAVFDPDRKGNYGLERDCTEEYLRTIGRELLSLGVVDSSNPLPYWKRVYGGTPEYRFTELGRAVLARIPELSKKPSRKERARWRQAVLRGRA